MKLYGMTTSVNKVWIIGLVVSFCVLNFLAFSVYQKTTMNYDFWVQVWNYIGSTPFEYISICILLPLFLFVLESRYKLLETMYKNRLEREKKLKEELRERRLDGIDKTADMWNCLYDLVTEVRCFAIKGSGLLSVHDTSNIMMKLYQVRNAGEDVVNLWGFRFGLSHHIQELFLTYINILLESSLTVAHYIRVKDKTAVDLQNSLGIIQEGVTSVAHHPIISILKNRLKLLEVRENGGDSVEENLVQMKIDGDVERLDLWAKELNGLKLAHNKILNGIEGNEVDVFRIEAKRLELWLHQNTDKRSGEYEGFSDFINSYKAIPHELAISAANVRYSKQCLNEIANWFGIEVQIMEMERLASVANR